MKLCVQGSVSSHSIPLGLEMLLVLNEVQRLGKVWVGRKRLLEVFDPEVPIF